MSKHVLSTKLSQIQHSPFFALIADEYTDISNKEQVSICIRWIDPESLSAYEDFLGFYEVRDIKRETIVKAIQDALVRFQLLFSKLRAQTYGGTSNMMGRKSGVATKIKEIQNNAFETHCHGHSLNLSVKVVTSQCKVLKDTIGIVGEICVLVKFSPKRENLLGELQENIEGDLQNEVEKRKPISLDKLCSTRWTVRAKCYQKIIDIYDKIIELLEFSLKEVNLKTEVKGRVIGCLKQVKEFDFYYGLLLSQRLFALTNNLSKTLQNKNMPAISGQRLARLTL